VLILIALGAAVLLAAGFVLQQHEAAEVPTGRFSPGLLLLLARRPIWLGGIAAMACGQVLGAMALGMSSLVVVEPLLATNVLFALPLAALASRRWLSRGDWAGAVLLIGGLALFLAGGAPDTAPDSPPVGKSTWLEAWAALIAVVLVALALARGRGSRVRAALLATAAGFLFGMQDFLTQRVVLRFGHGVWPLLASWRPWAVVIVAVVGLTLAQRAFGTADLSASLPAITLAEPVCGIALSIGVVGQPLPHRPILMAAALVGLTTMILGVVILTRSPLVVDPHGRRHRAHAATALRFRSSQGAPQR
jgi:drug/metabolite transporter (DMT)-like permease